MGAFNDLLNILRASVSGLVPFGGTLNPVSEGVPIGFAQNIKGNLAVYPTLEALADIPYQLLSLDMEVIVQEHTRPDTSTHVRTKYRLKILPDEGTKVSDIPSYDVTDFWEPLPGPGAGPPGVPGNNGYSPVYALEDDGLNRVVEKFYQWYGGTGPLPSGPTPPNDYRGSSGFVTKSLAINVKGPAGPPGADASAADVRPMFYASLGARRVTTFVVGTDPLYTIEVGKFQYFCPTYGLQVVNTWTKERWFMINGEIPVSNDNNWDAWAVRLCDFPTANPPTILALEGASIKDENYSISNFVNYGPPSNYQGKYASVHKIRVSYCALLQPGQTKHYYITACKTYGGDSYMSAGFLEAIGL